MYDLCPTPYFSSAMDRELFESAHYHFSRHLSVLLKQGGGSDARVAAILLIQMSTAWLYVKFQFTQLLSRSYESQNQIKSKKLRRTERQLL